ncbi:MAG TPA: hypothetical protein VMV53_09375 [Acidimicrobiales bacterium]|nr:hypothetical protein [Acidimicrobiales bacterium]
MLTLGVLATGIGVASASPHSHSRHGHDHGALQTLGAWDHGHGQGHGRGEGHGHGHGHAFAVRGFVTAISLDTTSSSGSITISGPHNSTSTFTLSTSTTVEMGPHTATLSDLKVGQRVFVKPLSTDATTAGDIFIAGNGRTMGTERTQQNSVEGLVSTLTTTTLPGSITVTDPSGTLTTFAIDGSTTVTLGKAPGALTDLSVGERVEISPSSTTATTAGTIEIELARVSGLVTGVDVSTNTITVTTQNGSTASVVVGATTTYAMVGTPTATLANVTTGLYISAKGIELTGTTTLNALSVNIFTSTGAAHQDDH